MITVSTVPILCARGNAHQKSVMTVDAGDTTEAGLRGHRGCDGTRGQVDDTLAVGPGASDALRRRLADQETIARTAHVFLAWWRIPYGLQSKCLCLN